MAHFDGWALIVVDMQNDFLAEDGYYARREMYKNQVRQGVLTPESMIEKLVQPGTAPSVGFKPRVASLNGVIEKIRHVITRSRAENIPIAYLKAVYDRSFQYKPRFLLEDPDRHHFPCRPRTWGAEFIDPVKDIMAAQQDKTKEKTIEKHTFNGFFKTDLYTWLQSWHVHTVLITGVETHICVLATAQSASFHQFRTIILKDCVATAREYRAQYALNIFRDGFGATMRSDEVFI